MMLYVAFSAPSVDAGHALLATSRIFNHTSGMPSSENFVAMVDLNGSPLSADDEQPSECDVKILALMDTVLCLYSAFDAANQLLYSICRTELAPAPPVTLEVRSVTGHMRQRVPLSGAAVEGTEWDLLAVDSQRHGVLLLALNSGEHGGRCVFVNPSTGASRILATLPWTFNPGWLVPTALFDPSARVMHSVVDPRSVDHATPAAATAASTAHAERLVIRAGSSTTASSRTTQPTKMSLLTLDLQANTTTLTPLDGDASALADGIWNLALTSAGLLGVTHTSTRAVINVTTGHVRLLCPTCRSLISPQSPNMPLVPITAQQGCVSGASTCRAFMRMDPDFDRPGAPTGRPTLFALDLEGRVSGACRMPANMSGGLMLQALA